MVDFAASSNAAAFIFRRPEEDCLKRSRRYRSKISENRFAELLLAP